MAVRALITLVALLTTTGCLYEHSFPFAESKIARLETTLKRERITAREWLPVAHRRLRHLLPDSGYEPLLTDDLTGPDGQPADVFDHFDKIRRYLNTGIGNMSGLVHTAQVTGDSEAIEIPAPDWAGFEDVWIEVEPGVQISARLGLATKDGRPIVSDCIVVLPGLLGDNIRLRTRDICMGLRDSGFHALALEFRGHGQAEAKYPDNHYTWGVTDTPDLLVVAEWLQDKANVRRTGLIGFSWSANTALLAAWEDGRPIDDPTVLPRVAACQPKFDRSRRHYEAGVFAVSPTLDFEHLLDRLETPRSFSQYPVLSNIQATVARRIERKQFGPPTGSLRTLIAYDLARSCLNYEESSLEGLTYLRLLPYKDELFRPKLEWARMPVVIMHAANDPLAYAQEVADFMSRTPNPNVASVVLHGGGHDGFAAYCHDYLYSMFVNFFDDRRGPSGSAYEPASY